MLKYFWLFILMFLFYARGFGQDTIRVAVPFDTLLFENVPVDTVVNTINNPANDTQIQKPFQSKFYYGGFVNVSFGSYTVIGLEPSLAYKFTPRLSLGTKLSFEYVHEKQGEYVYEESTYGFSLFSRMRILPGIYTHVEFSTVNYKFYNTSVEGVRKWVPFLFLGGGMSQPIAENVWFNAEVLFDVLQNENSPYNDWEPFYSVGFGVGF